MKSGEYGRSVWRWCCWPPFRRSISVNRFTKCRCVTLGSRKCTLWASEEDVMWRGRVGRACAPRGALRGIAAAALAVPCAPAGREMVQLEQRVTTGVGSVPFCLVGCDLTLPVSGQIPGSQYSASYSLHVVAAGHRSFLTLKQPPNR